MAQNEYKQNLTEDEIKILNEYKEKWIKIGLSTNRIIDKEEVNRLIKKCYKENSLKEPELILYFESPLACVYASIMLKNYGDRIHSEDENKLLPEIIEYFEKNSNSNNSQFKSEVNSILDNFSFGNHDSNWLGFYEFFLDVFKIEEIKKIQSIIELSKLIGWWMPYDNFVLVSEKPTEIHINKEGQIHKDLGPAIGYSDGFAVYALNGVMVTEEIALNPVDKFDTPLLLRTQNAEVRREIVRKLGIEKICIDLKAECVDKYDALVEKNTKNFLKFDPDKFLKEKDKYEKISYELLLLDLNDGRKRPYLKMTNPSIGVYHLEGVLPEIRTCEKALAWRNGLDNFSEPQKLT